MSPGEHARREAQALRDRLKAEGRNRDAQIVTQVIKSAASSSGLNKVLAREVRELTDRVRQAELEHA